MRYEDYWVYGEYGDSVEIIDRGLKLPDAIKWAKECSEHDGIKTFVKFVSYIENCIMDDALYGQEYDFDVIEDEVVWESDKV